jgi:2-hydroxychromene-2-carboxylate isomerase
VPIKIATGDYLITEALAYLERLGVPARVIRTLNVNTTVGEPIRLEVVMYVETEPEIEQAEQHIAAHPTVGMTGAELERWIADHQDEYPNANPCADNGCPDPIAHQEGAHDV